MKGSTETVDGSASSQNVDNYLSVHAGSSDTSGFADGLAEQWPPAVTRRQGLAGRTQGLKKPVRFVAMLP
ncbi:MAG TPA: hypothetical protein DCZ04_09995 [Syntrophorhabdus aromaticivorans]|nr:hypothetical protein [Syntrophorhabdus aromaticivorans]